MYMIEIAALENGAHRNQTYHDVLPEGWALIPDEMGELENFPFGDVTVEDVTHYRDVTVDQEVTKTREVIQHNNMGEEVIVTEEYTEIEKVVIQEPYTVPTVTEWIPGVMPEPAPEPEKEPTTEEILDAMLGVTTNE